MSNMVTTGTLPQSVAAMGIDEPTWNALKNSIYPGARDDSVVMAVSYCVARQLDPLMKPLHLVPMSVKDAQSGKNEWRDVVMPGIGLYRIQADRSGSYAGANEPEFGDDITKTLNGVEITFPAWCKYTVCKSMPDGKIVEFSAKEYWMENYATAGRDNSAPNAMWKKRPYGQLAKCFDKDTEVLTDVGFQRFSDVTGRVLQVTEHGLEYTESTPFIQEYSGPMVTANGTRLNFCVTPNHDMVTNKGKIEAIDLYKNATQDSSKWAIPRCIKSTRSDKPISDKLLKLVGYLLADGSHTGYHQFRIAVSRQYKVSALEEINLHSHRSIKKDAGRISHTDKRTIRTNFNKQSFSYDTNLVSLFMSHDKVLNTDWILTLSTRQARLVVDSLLEFDGSFNGSVHRLHQSNGNVIRAFEILAIQAGYSINKSTKQKSDIGECRMYTVSEAKSSPVIKGVNKSASSLTLTPNIPGVVWCVTVPSGVIVVRRNGFSMLCGNCAEAQALRKAWPEIGQQPTAEEMEGKSLDISDAKDVTPHKETQTPLTLPHYPADKFNQNLPGWQKMIESGSKKADAVIATVSTKFTLSEAQTEAIRKLEPIDGDLHRTS